MLSHHITIESFTHQKYYMKVHEVSSMLSHFAYMSTKLFHSRHKTHNHFEWSGHEHVCSSSARKQAHALITWIKVNLSGPIPSHCICWKSCIAFSVCPSFTYFLSFSFSVKLFNCTAPSAIAAISAATHGSCVGPQATVLPVSSYV